MNPELTQHVIQRGNNRMDMFRATSDYEVFLYALRDVAQRHDVKIHAYVLMTNHVHIMATPHSGAALGQAMQALGRRYVPFFNTRYGRTGGLFEGRYRSFAIESETYWFTCMRYVEFNPVRAGLATAPDAYRWSSYAAHALGAENLLLTPHPLYLSLGDSPEGRQAAWRAVCGEPLKDDELTEIRARVNMRRIVPSTGNPAVVPDGTIVDTPNLESSRHRGLTPLRSTTGV